MSKMYSDRDYLDEKFASLETILSPLVDKVDKLEYEINSAKLLGKVALGVTAVIGSLATWALGIVGKILAVTHNS